MEPAAPSRVAEALSRIALVCKHPQSEPKERELRAALYLKYFSGYPADALDAAADEWIRTNAWYPAISELTALCTLFMSERKALRAWIERALKVAAEKAERGQELERRGYDANTGLPHERPTPEDLQRLSRSVAANAAAKNIRLAEAKRKVAAVPVEPPVHPPRRTPIHVPLPDDRRESLLSGLSGR